MNTDASDQFGLRLSMANALEPERPFRRTIQTPTALWGLRFVAKFSVDVVHQTPQRIEVLWNYLIILDGDSKVILEENHEFERASGVDHMP
jgi:hypothetical protein